jgi:hypothetical protein
MTTTSIPVDDRGQILDLFARYCRGLDTQRREEFLSTFWEDGILDSSLLGGEFVGHARIADWYDQVHSQEEFQPLLGGQHRPANVIFDGIAPAEAVVWCQFELLTKVDGVPQVSAYGEYHDVVTKRGGEWRFSRREIVIGANAFAAQSTQI